MKFALHPGLDPSALAQRFASAGRLRIQPFLSESTAVALHEHLRAREDWRQVVNSGDKVFELDRAVRAAMSAEQRQALDQAVANGAREGFQYRYESIRLEDGNASMPAEGLNGFTRWLSTGEARALLRTVTGFADVDFADGQATAYSPGDFLTGHDDDVVGKHRRAAYVLGLTPTWRLEWGGLLLFHGADGSASGWMPSFNSIDIFAVPQIHSVSLVSPAAAFRRYSITGWLRSDANGA